MPFIVAGVIAVGTLALEALPAFIPNLLMGAALPFGGTFLIRSLRRK